MKLADLFQHFECLIGQFSRWRYNQHAQAIVHRPSGSIETFENLNEGDLIGGPPQPQHLLE